MPDLVDHHGQHDGPRDQTAGVKLALGRIGNESRFIPRQQRDDNCGNDERIKPMHPEPSEQAADLLGNRPAQKQRSKQNGKRDAVSLQAPPEPRNRKRIHHGAIKPVIASLASRRLPLQLVRHVTVAEKQTRLIANYSIIDDPQERLAAVVDDARRQPALPDAARTEANRVKGCVSQAWIAAEFRDGRCHFQSDADSPLVRGLLKLMCELYSGGVPSEIIAADTTLFEELGLVRNLSPTRLNGLQSVRAKIREFAGQCVP